jgi:hypothetical protein
VCTLPQIEHLFHRRISILVLAQQWDIPVPCRRAPSGSMTTGPPWPRQGPDPGIWAGFRIREGVGEGGLAVRRRWGNPRGGSQRRALV